MIVDKYTKTAWTILAISLFVISEIGFKNYQSSASSKGFIYTRHQKKKWYVGLRQDFSVVLDSFRSSLYLGVGTSIVKYPSDSYCYGYISDVDKKVA